MRLLVVVVVLVALAGCNDKDGDGASFETPPKEDNTYIITVDRELEPSHAKVPEGSVVEWRVEGQGCHLVADDGAFDSKRPQGGGTTYNNGVVPAGQTYRWLAGEPGEHPYGCAGRSIDGVLRVV